MSLKDDLLRALQYGKTEYYRAIQQIPSYQAELSRTLSDYKGRSWIESPFKLPRFTDAEFEARRNKYQAKYGTVVNIPGFNDIIHLKIPVKITTEQMAAHRFAIARGLPSPLSIEQLQALQGRKYRFLRALASPTPAWLKNMGAVSTFLDNSEDALVTAAVLGRLLVKFGPRVFQKLIPGLGWILLGSDIINITNIIGQISFAAMGKKRIVEDLAHQNPFHSKAAASRTKKLQRTWPAFGEMLEILQTTDQLFGVGLCLGPIVGIVQDAIAYDINQRIQYGINIVGSITDPTTREKMFADTLRYGPILGAMSWMNRPDEFLKMMMTFNGAISGLWNWWIQNDPMAKIQGLQNIKIKPPTADSLLNIEIGKELGIDITPSPLWPIIEKPEATLSEIFYAYAAKAKEAFQIFAFSNPVSYEAYAAGAYVVDYTKKVIASQSDDFTARVSTTAYGSAAKDMARDVLQIPPDTPQWMIDKLSAWIGDYERKTGGSPSTKEIEFQGRLMGIRWDRTFPAVTFGKAAEAFPEWNKIKDLLGKDFVGD